MKNLTTLTFLVLFCWGNNSYGQGQYVKIGDDARNHNDYCLAIENYEKALLKDPNDMKTRLKLADCYRLNFNVTKALESYELYLSGNSSPKKEVAYDYADLLLRNRDLKKAKIVIKGYQSRFPTDPEFKRLMENCLFAEKELLKKPDFPENALEYINSDGIDFGPYIKNDTFYFASNRPRNVDTEEVTDFCRQTDLFIYYIKEPWKKPELIKGNINSESSDGSFSCSENPQSWCYSAQVRDGVTVILKSKYHNGKWVGELINIGPTDFNYCHPSVTPDGKTVYFVSDWHPSPKTPLGLNIWKASIDGKGNFISPKPLENTINTDKDEIFPFIIGDSILLFSSSGHVGMGGLDIFKSEIKNGLFQEPINFGSPVNSTADDYSPFLKKNGRGLYFASSRNYDMKKDEIYSHPTTILDTLRILVIDCKTRRHLEGASVTIYKGGDEIEENMDGFTNNDGRVKFPYFQHIDCSLHNQHSIYVSLKGYVGKTDTILCYNKDEKIICLDAGPCIPKILSGIVYNIYTNEGVPDVKVVLVSSSGHKDSIYTDNKGKYKFEKVPCDELINLTVAKEGYYTETFPDKTPGGDNPNYEKNIGITPIFPPIKVYFEFDSCRVLEKYHDGLDILAKLFKSNPDKIITIESNTDERGELDYNMRLSECRGMHVRAYLIMKGVNPKMLKNDNFGELNPVIRNASTEEEHQLNRRTEFRAEYLRPYSQGSYSPPSPTVTKTSTVPLGIKVFDQAKPDQSLDSPSGTVSFTINDNGSPIPVQASSSQNSPNNATQTTKLFRIQISALKSPVNVKTRFSNIAALIQGYQIYEKFEDNLYKYQIGEFNSEEEAKSLCSGIDVKGYKGCFVVEKK